MRRQKREHPVEHLNKLLDYDPDTGEFTWRERTADMTREPTREESGRKKSREHMTKVWNTRFAGKPAFRIDRIGYMLGSVDKKILFAHRVAWAMHYGEWPPHEMEVDHINGDRADNRIANLRIVTPAENSKNKRLQKTNRSGYAGVVWVESRQRWEAGISDAGRAYHLGSFYTKAEAVAARKAAEKVLGYHEKHGRLDRPTYEDPPRPGRSRNLQRGDDSR